MIDEGARINGTYLLFIPTIHGYGPNKTDVHSKGPMATAALQAHKYTEWNWRPLGVLSITIAAHLQRIKKIANKSATSYGYNQLHPKNKADYSRTVTKGAHIIARHFPEFQLDSLVQTERHDLLLSILVIWVVNYNDYGSL